MKLIDSYQRRFAYLRLSVTDRCNFRCVYCLPQGYRPRQDSSEDLSVDEIRRLVTAFARLGIVKVRLTGGEPTVRRDIVELARAVAGVPGIRKLAITTNGYRLTQLARPLRAAGVSAVNVSIDSLDSDRFRKITGMERSAQVLEGVERAIEAGFQDVKVNAVLLKDLNEHEVADFMEWVRDRPISVRFIELMQTGKNEEFFRRRHVTAGAIQLSLRKSGWQPASRGMTDGPALVYRHPNYQGSIGLIAPYSKDFCAGCNRLRVSSRGALRLCLFGEKDQSLRDLLSNDGDIDRLEGRVLELLREKPASHRLQEGIYGNTWNLASIGG